MQGQLLGMLYVWDVQGSIVIVLFYEFLHLVNYPHNSPSPTYTFLIFLLEETLVLEEEKQHTAKWHQKSHFIENSPGSEHTQPNHTQIYNEDQTELMTTS